MPRPAKGPRLYLVHARRDAKGRTVKAARWVIRDGDRMHTTGCGAGDVGPAHQALADYLKAAHRPTRKESGVTKLAYRVDDAADMIGLGRSKVWELINQGRIPARKIDAATVVLHADLEAFLARLPLSDSAKRSKRP